MSWVPPPPPSTNFFIQTIKPVDAQILAIVDNNGKQVMTIESDGTIIWYQPGKANEAADIFVDAISETLERRADIKQGRKEWEARILKALISEAKNAPLTPEVLTDVVRKAIMIDKLKGLK